MKHAKLLTIISVAVLAVCTSLSADRVKLHSSGPVSTEPAASDLIKDYKQWTRVNPVPVDLNIVVSASCVAVTQPDIDPHHNKFITVYVNEVGTKSMLHEMRPHFPQGTVIIKEKLPAKDSSSPELLTVMVKRQDGYNPENGNWEYMAFDGTGKEVQARGKLGNCQSCHTMAQANDYVYRTYLSEKVRRKLK